MRERERDQHMTYSPASQHLCLFSYLLPRETLLQVKDATQMYREEYIVIRTLL